MSRVTLEIGALRLHFESPEDMDAQLGRMGELVSVKEMAAMIGVSERTVQSWKHLADFPRTENGAVTRAAFLQFLFRANPPQNPAKSRN